MRSIVADQQLAAGVIDAGAGVLATLRAHIGKRLPRPLPDEVVDAVPVEAHDRPVDAVLTPTGGLVRV